MYHFSPKKSGSSIFFSDFFKNLPNYVISMSHIVFQGELGIAEHISNKIMMWQPLFDSLRRHFWPPHLKNGSFWPYSLTTGSKARFRKKFDFCNFFKVLPQVLKCYLGFLEVSLGLLEGVSTPQTPQMMISTTWIDFENSDQNLIFWPFSLTIQQGKMAKK